MGDRRILAVDWDARELRVVHARVRKEKVCVEDVFAVSIPSDVAVTDAQAMGRLLRRAIEQEGIGCRRAIVDIPRDQAVVHALTVPNVSASDMAGMVELQVAKSLPFPVGEAVIDFALPPEGEGDAEGQREVLAAAVRSELVDFYRQVCQNAGLRLDRIGLRPYATKVAISAFLGAGLPQRVLVVDIGPMLTEIDVLRRGQLSFSRAASVYVPLDGTTPVPMTAPAHSDETANDNDRDRVSVVPFGAAIDTGPRDVTAVVADLMVEVTRSIEAYRGTDPGAEMDCGVVAGATGIEETLAEAINRRFGINCETYNPSAWFDGDAERGAAACGFSAALGLVLGHAAEGRRHFDFLHPKKQEAPGQAQLKKVPLIAAAVTLFVVAGLAYYLQGPAKQFARRRRIEEQIAEVKAEIKENKGFVKMVEEAKKFEAQQIVWIDEFSNLVALLPDRKKVVLDKLDMDQDGPRLQIGFRASDSTQEGRIIKSLEAFRVEGANRPRYEAKVGPTSENRKDKEYRHQGSVSVKIVGAATASKKGGRRR